MKASAWKLGLGLTRGAVPPGSPAPLLFCLPSFPATFLGFPLVLRASPALTVPDELSGVFLAFAALLSDLVPRAG